MTSHAIINAGVNSQRHQSTTGRHDQWSSAIPHLRQIEEEQRLHDRQTSYGATGGSSSTSPLDRSPRLSSIKGKEPEIVQDQGGYEDDDEEEYEEMEVFEPVIDGMSTIRGYG